MLRCLICLAVLAAPLLGAAPAPAAPAQRVVASFSILADMVSQVGGDRVRVSALVGRGADAHVFEPAPRDVRTMGEASLFIVNGLGFEGWTARLIEAAGFSGLVAVASNGITPLPAEPGRRDHDGGARDGASDPHAWQDLQNALVYVANIARALCGIDAEGCPAYEDNATRYNAAITALDREIRDSLGRLPEGKRRIITSHDSFAYFARAYGVEMLAPVSTSTDTEPSARDVAALIRQIRDQGVTALFVENASDRRLLEQIARETGIAIGGELFSDTLSQPGGPAATYLDMMRHNARQLLAAFGA